MSKFIESSKDKEVEQVMHGESAEDNFGSSSNASAEGGARLLLLMLNKCFLLVLRMSKNTSKSIVMMQA